MTRPHATRLLGLFTLLLATFLGTCVSAQETFPYNGVYDQRDGHYAFTNAKIHVSPSETIEGTIVIKDGKIVSVGSAGADAGAVTVDVKGKHIYPSFIEAYGDYGMPKTKAGSSSWNDPPQLESKTAGAFAWKPSPPQRNRRLGQIHDRQKAGQSPPRSRLRHRQYPPPRRAEPRHPR